MKQLQRRANYIDGAWLFGKDETETRSPSDRSDVIGHFANAEVGQIDDAVAAARHAFPGWSRSTAEQRSDALKFIAQELLTRKAELGELLSREEGKTLKEGINEVAKSASVFEYFAAEALRPVGERFPSVRNGIDVEAIREPVGVVAVITPWNLPIGTPSWKIAPALAYGNCVIFKPSNFVPASAWALTEIISRSKIPSGVFSLVMGAGAQTGGALVNSAGIDAISFTGSTGTGLKIAAAAIQRGHKLQMEMGGKNPLVVLDDANVEVAADCALKGAYFATGQRCTASSRLIVTDGIHDQFVNALLSKMEKLKAGHALDPSSDIGPVMNENQLTIDERFIEIGKREGAKLLRGGSRLTRDTEGFFFEPALFVDTTNSFQINKEEIFGPIAAVIRVKNYEEAVNVANDTSYGLASGICTNSPKYARDFKQRAQSGICMVNLPTAGSDFHAPFGGRKKSNYGSRELSGYAREFFTSVKTTYSAVAD